MSESTFSDDRVPVPTGWATPTELSHILRARKIIERLPAQQIYNWIKKPGSNFPFRYHEDGRKIVPVDDSIQWIVSYLQEKAERESVKALAAAQKAAEAAAAANIDTQPAVIAAAIGTIEDDEWRDWRD